MRLWEEHKPLAVMAGSAAGLYALLYLFLIGPNYASGTALAANREANQKAQLEKYFTRGTKLDYLRREYDGSNKKLEERFKAVKDIVSRPIPDGLIPEENKGLPQNFVRQYYEQARLDLMRAVSGRKFKFASLDKGFGLKLPEEYSAETPEQSLAYAERICALKDFVLALIKVAEEKDGTPAILSVDSVVCQEAQLAGMDAAFIKEIPISLELTISLSGLCRLLGQFSQPGDFHAVRDIEIKSDAASRSAGEVKVSEQKIGEAVRTQVRSEHYYKVALTAARVMVLDQVKLAAAATATGGGVGAAKPIMH